MAWCVVYPHLEVAKGDTRPVVEDVNRGRLLDIETKECPVLNGTLVQELIVSVQIHGDVECPLRLGDATHVVYVRMGQQDVPYAELALAHDRDELVDLVTRVDDDGLERARARDDEAILHERGHGSNFEDHRWMVLCVLDDLLFSVKISTAAKHLAADVFFERNAEQVLARTREKRPTLVIFDLNSVRLRPLEAIAALKADAELSSIPTLGFVSHMDAETISVARAAGVDEVMARSAFAARLPDLLIR